MSAKDDWPLEGMDKMLRRIIGEDYARSPGFTSGYTSRADRKLKAPGGGEERI